MFTTDLVNLYNRNIFKTSLFIYIFQDEKCCLMRNLSLSMDFSRGCHELPRQNLNQTGPSFHEMIGHSNRQTNRDLL